MNKIKNLEFLRIILMFSILLFHLRVRLSNLDIDLFKTFYTNFNYGYNAVDGFFILSGFLFFYTLKKNKKIIDFIIDKYVRLVPALMVSFCLCAIGSCIGIIKFKLIPNIVTVLLLSSFGRYWCIGSDNVLWFIPALFYTLLLFFILYKCLPSKIIPFAIPIITILNYFILLTLNKGYLNGYDVVYYNFLSVANMRALGGVGLGCCIGMFHKYLTLKTTNCKPSCYIRSLCTIIELSLLYFIYRWLFVAHNKINDVYFILLFSLVLICFIQKKGYITQLLDINVWSYFSKYTYSIYAIHGVLIIYFYKLIIPQIKNIVYEHPLLIFIIEIIFICTLGVIVYYFIENPAINVRIKRRGKAK